MTGWLILICAFLLPALTIAHGDPRAVINRLRQNKVMDNWR